MKRVLLYIFSAIALVGPLIIWSLLVGMGCAYVTNNSTSCGVELHDFFEIEFLQLAIGPWAIGALCLYLAARRA